MPREKTRGFRTMAATTTTTMFLVSLTLMIFATRLDFQIQAPVSSSSERFGATGDNGRAAKTRPMFVRRLHAWISPLPPPATAHAKVAASHPQLGRGGRSVLTPAMAANELLPCLQQSSIWTTP